MGFEIDSLLLNDRQEHRFRNNSQPNCRSQPPTTTATGRTVVQDVWGFEKVE